MTRLFLYADILLAGLLALLGIGLPLYRGVTLDAAAVGALSGALFGGAAVLFGNWINRRADRLRAKEEIERRRTAVMTLVTAELVNVAAGHLGAKNFLDSAAGTIKAGRQVPNLADMSPYLPREMPFTDSLGAELLILEQRAIDALATLRSNLAMTRASMDAITEGRTKFGVLRIPELMNAVCHDMEVLAEAFTHIAPTRRFSMSGNEAELVTTILRRAAAERAG